MVALMPRIDPIGNPEPLYEQVANVIAARIEVGTLAQQLPAERLLAQEFGVAYQTLRHAMQTLRDRGLVITRQGRGTFVVPPAQRDASD